MGYKIDIAKGRLEEAAGVLAGNDRLRRKGRTDQAVARVIEITRQVVGGVNQQVGGRGRRKS